MEKNDPVERAPRVICPKCGRFMQVDHEFCPHCGARRGGGDAWYYNPVWILVLAFLVIGPFALIFVWKSQKMSRAGKTIMAIAILAYTVFGAYYTFKVGAAEWREISDLQRVMRQIR